MSDEFAFSCPYCQIGYCQPGNATYVRIHEGTLISVPDMLIWTCDICGYQEYDRDAMSNLDALLGHVDTGETQRPKVSEPFEKTNSRRLKP